MGTHPYSHRKRLRPFQEGRYRKRGATTLVMYLLTLLFVWWYARSVLFGFSPSASAGSGAGQAPSSAQQPAQISPMDVVGIAVKPTCVTEFSIEKLNELLKPRLIHVFTPTESKCELFRGMASNVRCYTDGEVVPGVSKKTVEDALVSTFGAAYTDYVKKSGKKMTGWYLQQVSGVQPSRAPLSIVIQADRPPSSTRTGLSSSSITQFVKLGVSRYLGERLTENFLIWDLDMIMMKPMEAFTSDPTPRALVNVGGKIHIHKGYELCYERLTNRTLEIAPDGTSYVTHSLSASKRHMEGLLREFEGEAGRDSWPWNIIRSIDPDYLGYGFSEYASYVSYMIQNHPDEVKVKRRRTWTRYPPGASLGVAALKLISPNHLCCPTDSFLKLVKPLGYEFMGFEIGHSSLCGYHDKAHEESYGLMKGA